MTQGGSKLGGSGRHLWGPQEAARHHLEPWSTTPLPGGRGGGASKVSSGGGNGLCGSPTVLSAGASAHGSLCTLRFLLALLCLSAPGRPPSSLGLRTKSPSAVRGDFEGANQSTSPSLEVSEQMGDWEGRLTGGQAERKEVHESERGRNK